jgi:flagellin
LNVEYQQLLDEVDQIANNNEVMGIHLLVGKQVAGKTPGLADLFPVGGAKQTTMPSGIKPIAYIPTGATNVQIDIDSFGADDDLQIFTRGGTHLVGTPLNDRVWANNGVNTAADVQSLVMRPDYGFTAGASYDASILQPGDASYTNPAGNPASLSLNQNYHGMNIAYSGDGDHADGSPNDGMVAGGYTLERVTFDKLTEPLLVMVAGSGVFSVKASWDKMPSNAFVPPAPPGVGPIDIGLQADVTGDLPTLRIEQAPSDTATLGIGTSDVSSPDNASQAMRVLDAAINRVSGYRAQLGASSARLDRAIDQIGQAGDGLQVARSRVMDADMAQAASALASAQIRSQAGQAMLAQANSLPRQVLQMLLDGARFSGT